jgi:hypothetical protein
MNRYARCCELTAINRPPGTQKQAAAVGQLMQLLFGLIKVETTPTDRIEVTVNELLYRKMMMWKPSLCQTLVKN